LAVLLHAHTPFFREIFDIPDFFTEPVLCFGFQDVMLKIKKPKYRTRPKPTTRIGRLVRWVDRHIRYHLGLPVEPRTLIWTPKPLPEIPDEFRVNDLVELIRNRGVKDIRVVDHFDPRADLRYDMNEPVPESEHDRYGTLIDIGCLEHLFDTRQCVENCLRMVRPGGLYFLHTPVNGYFGHGLHTFNPEALIGAAVGNGFEIVYLKFSARDGTPVENAPDAEESIIWLVARKTRRIETFEVPQQGRWSKYYPTPS
jgi:hypothetical protein